MLVQFIHNWKSRFLWLWTFILFFFGPFTVLYSDVNVEVIKNPKPTHYEKKYVTLKLIKAIDSDIDDTHFFAQLASLQVDDEGGIYCYDNVLKKVYKFDKNFKLERIFGKRGQGPGEYTGNDWGLKNIYFAPDGLLYIRAPYNRHIIAFDKKGKNVKNIRLGSDIGVLSCPVVVDGKNNFNFLSFHGGAVDVYDGEMKHSCTLLEKKDYARFVFYRPVKTDGYSQVTYIEPAIFNTYHDILPGDRMIIYLANSSRVFIFKNNRLNRQFDVWPQKAVQGFKKMLKEKLHIDDEISTHFTPFAYNMIVDIVDFYNLPIVRHTQIQCGRAIAGLRYCPDGC